MHIFDLVKTTGPAVLGPLMSLSGDAHAVYYAAFNGSPILKNGKFGPESSFTNEEDALSFAKRFAKEVHGWSDET